MKTNYLGMVFFLVLGIGALVPAAAAQATLPDGEGKAQVERVCTVCHTLDTVTATRRSREDWMMVIEDMQTRGAQGSDRDFVEIVNYLSTHFGPETAPSKNSEAPKGETQGAETSKPPAEASSSQSKSDAATATVNINKASIAELVSALNISQESASAIVRYRETNGAIKSWETLKAVPNIDLRQLESSKQRIEF